jgi:hypothetical protein
VDRREDCCGAVFFADFFVDLLGAGFRDADARREDFTLFFDATGRAALRAGTERLAVERFGAERLAVFFATWPPLK